MQITGTADINKTFKSMASDIKELINTRDTAYKEIDRINADNDLSGEGKLHKASAVHEAYAESRLTAEISNVCSKVNVFNEDEAARAFDVEAPLTDLQNEIESGIGVAKSGSSPIKMIYVNGKLVDGDLNLTTNSDLSRI